MTLNNIYHVHNLRKEIKDILSYLNFLVNPDDSVSFERVLNVPKRGIGESTLQKLRDFSNKFEMYYTGFTRLSSSILESQSKEMIVVDKKFKLMKEKKDHIKELLLGADL